MAPLWKKGKIQQNNADRREGVLNELLYGEAPPRGLLNCLNFYKPFLKDKVPRPYTLYCMKNGTPFK